MITGLILERRTDLARCLAHVPEVDPGAVERRADRDQRQIGRKHRSPQIGGRAQSDSDIPPQNFLEPGFVDRRLAAVDDRDFAASMSTHVHVCPTSAKHAPDTNPT